MSVETQPGSAKDHAYKDDTCEDSDEAPSSSGTDLSSRYSSGNNVDDYERSEQIQCILPLLTQDPHELVIMHNRVVT
eukprot:CAMPEP_0175976890 /NCGR_PEP_ID=MMETSP0108-20121206/44774_1 /TAXON_ID=195067 ORGANISM="Goniomonas pacifica, Strain CCMP1869" /NCGR_SAMPLE_ID=MMETSP0108 /ASSEMBLY_ACC=CAM_ASM_000204 /LENGTH=76 /DNA_ID=CAMNT_0017306845 /DNA_START=458 /DNA_END=688 /DNA_ORIENTATION=-